MPLLLVACTDDPGTDVQAASGSESRSESGGAGDGQDSQHTETDEGSEGSSSSSSSGGDTVLDNEPPTLSGPTGPIEMTVCEPSRVCVRSSDPNGDPLAFTWEAEDAIAITDELIEQQGDLWTACVTLTPAEVSPGRLQVIVRDLDDDGRPIEDSADSTGPSRAELSLDLSVFDNGLNCEEDPPTGTTRWKKLFPNQAIVYATAIAPDGNIFICGRHDASNEVVFAMLDDQGEEIWSRTHDLLEDDSDQDCTTLLVSQTGRVFVTGAGFTKTAGSRGYFAEISAVGELVSATPLAPGALPRSLVQDSIGRLFLAGGSTASNSWVTEVDPSGLPLWQHDLETPDEHITDVVIANDGQMIIFGGTSTLGSPSMWIQRIEPGDSQAKWTRTIEREGKLYPVAFALDRGTPERLVLVGAWTPAGEHESIDWFAKISTDDSLAVDWEISEGDGIEKLPGRTSGIGVDARGHVILVNTIHAATGSFPVHSKLDRRGRLLWRHQLELDTGNSSAFSTTMAIDDEQGLVFAGYVSGSQISWVSRHDP